MVQGMDNLVNSLLQMAEIKRIFKIFLNFAHILQGVPKLPPPKSIFVEKIFSEVFCNFFLPIERIFARLYFGKKISDRFIGSQVMAIFQKNPKIGPPP